MERQPEENNNAKYCKQSIDTLFDFSSTHLDFLFIHSCSSFICFCFRCRIREALLICHINNQRNNHSTDSSHKGILETAIKYIKIIIHKYAHIRYRSFIQDNTVS